MLKPQARENMRFGFRWLTATTVGCGVGALLAVLASPFLARIVSEVRGGHVIVCLVLIIIGAIVGVCVGDEQNRVLRQRIGKLSGWVSASVMGCAVGMPLSFLLAEFVNVLARIGAVDSILILFFPFALIGVLLSVPQSLVLKRYVSPAWLWIPTNMVGWGMALPFAIVLFFDTILVLGEPIFPLSMLPAALIGIFGIGIAPGAITGGALIWLLNRLKV